MTNLETHSQNIETCFRLIHDRRMRGMPIVNDALEVQTIGFREWKKRAVGILITPWFMNLMLLPAEGESWDGLELGEKRDIEFPSRSYPFSVNEFDGIGRCLTHSLCSPMFQFDDQAGAVAFAESVMAGLEQEAEQNLSDEEAELERYMRKEGLFDGESKSAEGESEHPLSDKLDRPIDRRELLFGAFRANKGDAG